MYKNKKPKKENEQQKYRPLPPKKQQQQKQPYTQQNTHTKKQNRYISANMSSSGVNKTQTKHTTLQKDKIRQFTVFFFFFLDPYK